MCPGGPYQNPPGHIFYAGDEKAEMREKEEEILKTIGLSR